MLKLALAQLPELAIDLLVLVSAGAKTNAELIFPSLRSVCMLFGLLPSL
jgi:hypothetical protein